MHKSKFPFKGLAATLAAGTAFLFATAAFAVQTVTPVNAGGTDLSLAAQSVAAGGSITIIGRYNVTAPQTANESGLGLKLKYDAAKFSNVVVNTYATKCAIAPPQVQTNGASSQVVAGWIDTSIRAAGAVGWPGTADVLDPNGCLEIAGITEDDAAKTLPYELFSITFTTAAGFGTAAIQLVSEGNFSYANTGNADINKTVNLTQSAGGGLTLAASNPIVSRKTHGAAGVFDIPLTSAAIATPDVEPRQATPAAPHRIVYTFTSAPAASGNTVSVRDASNNIVAGVTATTSVSGNSVIVELSGVGTNQRLNVSLDNAGGTGTSFAVPVGFLVGDVNNSRSVSVGDINAVRAVSGQTTNATNFKFDLNVSGAISVGDINIVRSTSGTVLAP
jgi:hypothetical protein